MTSSTAPSCECSDTVVCDSSGSAAASRFGVVPFTLGVSSGLPGCAWLPVSSFCQLCPSSGISTSMPAGTVYWFSSTMGVGFTGDVSSDGIWSTLTTSGGCCSLFCDCVCALVLTLECLEVWLSSSFFGGAMVVGFDHPSSSVSFETSVIFSLCLVYSIALCLF
jgi:hypothetical protein